MLQLEHTCAISRNQTVGTNGRRQLVQIAASAPCLALPMNGPAAIQNGFDLGRAYDFFFDLAADVKVKDKLTCGGKDYTVTAVQRYDVPRVGHLHVLAQQEIGS